MRIVPVVTDPVELVDMCEGLAENLSPLDMQVVPFIVGNPTPPVAEVVPDDEEYHQAYQDGRYETSFKVRVFVATGAPDRGAQERLYAFMKPFGPFSIKELLENGEGLNGLAKAMKVTGRTGPRAFTRPGAAPLIGAEWSVTVYPLLEKMAA
jgi:hypothetical protein